MDNKDYKKTVNFKEGSLQMNIVSIIIRLMLTIGPYIFLGSILTIIFQTNDWVLNVRSKTIDPWTYAGEYMILFLWPLVLIYIVSQLILLGFKHFVKTKIKPRRKKKINIVKIT